MNSVCLLVFHLVIRTCWTTLKRCLLKIRILYTFEAVSKPNNTFGSPSIFRFIQFEQYYKLLENIWKLRKERKDQMFSCDIGSFGSKWSRSFLSYAFFFSLLCSFILLPLSLPLYILGKFSWGKSRLSRLQSLQNSLLKYT